MPGGPTDSFGACNQNRPIYSKLSRDPELFGTLPHGCVTGVFVGLHMTAWG